MLVSVSTECFANYSLLEALERIVDLEFAHVEIAIHETGKFLKPSEIVADLEGAVDICRNTKRLNIVSYSVKIAAQGDQHYEQFKAICKLAKATKVVSITVPSAELGTPFNEEVEHLRRLVNFASVEGVLVSIKSEVDCLSQDPDTVVVMCNNVKGLGVTLDPSHYICGPHRGGNYDQLMKYVYHVQLRDSTPEELQVRIGQGQIEYGRLINHLRKNNFDGALSVHVADLPHIDHLAELRKMRLLLESLV